MKIKIISLVVFFCGAALLSASLLKSQRAAGEIQVEPQSFVIHYLAYRPGSDGILTPYEFAVRAVSSTGEWKETRYSFDGKVSTWGAAKESLFTVSGNAKQYYGEFDLELARGPMASEEGFKKHPQLVRTEQLAGLKTYVLRVQNGIETSYSLQTGKTILKAVIYSSEGDIIDLVEALKVEFRDLSQEEVQLPNLPVRFNIVEQKIQKLREAGQSDYADHLQQATNKLKTSNK